MRRDTLKELSRSSAAETHALDFHHTICHTRTATALIASLRHSISVAPCVFVLRPVVRSHYDSEDGFQPEEIYLWRQDLLLLSASPLRRAGDDPDIHSAYGRPSHRDLVQDLTFVVTDPAH